MNYLKFIVCSMMLLAFACSSDKSEDEGNKNGGGNGSGESLKLTVMSFNIRYSSSASTDTGDTAWDNRKTACVNMIKDQKPAVIGMQESRTAQRSFLKSMLTEYELLETPGTGTGTGANATVLYRKNEFTRVNWGYFYLSATPDTPSKCFDATSSAHRNAVWVRLRENETGCEFVFCATHLPEYSADVNARTQSASLIVSRLKEASVAGSDIPVFVVGDMNCENSQSGIAPFYQWFQSARERSPESDQLGSYNGFGSSSKMLDHIFYRNATPIRFRTIDSDGYGVKYVSDHYPIIFTSMIR